MTFPKHLIAYRFSLPALKLSHDCLSNRQHGTKINHDFSSWEEVLFGVPQDSLFGSILFHIFLDDFVSCHERN